MKTMIFARYTKSVLPTAAFLIALLSTTALPILMNPPSALAYTDTYPTSIAGCRAVSGSPSGYFACDLKDSTQDIYLDPWGEENRECTSYASWMLHSVNGFEIPFYDDAKNWGPDASSRGYTVDMTPAVGSIYWSNAGTFGHVAYVQSVSSDGTHVDTTDYNSDFTGHFAQEINVATSSASGYIHFKDTAGITGTATSSQVINGVEHIFVGDSAGTIQDISWGNGSVLTQWQPAALSPSAAISAMTSQVSNGVITLGFASGASLYSVSWGNGVSPSITGQASFTSNITALSSRVTADGAIHMYVGAGSEVWNVSWGNGTTFNKTRVGSESATVNALSNQVTSDGYQNVYVALNNGAIVDIYWLSNPSLAAQWIPETLSYAPVSITSQLVSGVTNIDVVTANYIYNIVYGNGATLAIVQVGSTTGRTFKAIDSTITSDGYQHAIAGTSDGGIVDSSWSSNPNLATQWQPGAYPAAVVGLTTQLLSGVIQANGITRSAAENLYWGGGANPTLYQVSTHV